jgi:predicted RNA-binding Zn ribbon-like protein
MAKPTTPETIRLIGGRLCLDFANSVDWSEDDEPVTPEATDALTTPERLVRWGERMDLLLDSGAVEKAELARARELRDAVYRVFAAIAEGGAPEGRDLEAVRRSHAEGVGTGEMEATDGGWRLAWPTADPRRVRWAVAADAVDLLADPARVRRCPGHRCGWLFFDTTGRRRWCSMELCGARAKMRRLYARQRAGRD